MRFSRSKLLLMILLPVACNNDDEPEPADSCEDVTAEPSDSDPCGDDSRSLCTTFRDSLLGRVSEYSLRGRVLVIECEDQACAARVVWPNYGSAVQEYATLLSGGSCETSATLDEPKDVCAPYEATLRADCN
jgi:hypothetical protein